MPEVVMQTIALFITVLARSNTPSGSAKIIFIVTTNIITTPNPAHVMIIHRAYDVVPTPIHTLPTSATTTIDYKQQK